MGEFYEHGERIGKASASWCRKEVLECKTSEELGKLAGIKLMATVATCKDFWTNYDTWRAGFWDGFCDKGEQLIKWGEK